MIDAATRAQAQRVFEATLRETRYRPTEPCLLACTLPDIEGTAVVVAQYWYYPDGTFVRVTEEGER